MSIAKRLAVLVAISQLLPSVAAAEDTSSLERALLSDGVSLYEGGGDGRKTAVIQKKEIDDVAARAILEKLSRFPKLHRLQLEAVVIGDSSLAHISILTSIDEIAFFDTHVGISTCTAISQLKNVRDVTLKNCGLTEDTLAILCTKSAYRFLNISENRALKKGQYKCLVQLHEVKQLNLKGLDIDDKDAASIISEITSLEGIVLDGTAATDRMLGLITPSSKIRDISVRDTAVTEAAAKSFVEIHPEIKILIGKMKH